MYFVGSSGQTQIAKFNDVSDGDSISLSQQQINTIYGLSPNRNSLSIKWDLETLSDTTNLGTSSLNSTAIITNANPQFSSFDYEDINTKTIQLTQDSKTSVSGFSNIKVSVTPATGTKGATIDHYLINNTLVSPSNLPYTIIGMVGDTINVYAVDTRGNSTSLSKKVSKFINYQKLGKGNATALRDGGSSTQTKLSFSGTFWQGNFGAVENTLKVKYRYKKVTDTSFVDGTTAIVLTESQNKFSFDDYVKGDSPDNGFILDKSYNIIVEIEDSLDKITFDNITLMAGSPAIDGHLNKVALGGEYDENLGGTQFWGCIFK